MDPEVAVTVIVEVPVGVPGYLLPLPLQPLSMAIEPNESIARTRSAGTPIRRRRRGITNNSNPAKLIPPSVFVHDVRLLA